MKEEKVEINDLEVLDEVDKVLIRWLRFTLKDFLSDDDYKESIEKIENKDFENFRTILKNKQVRLYALKYPDKNPFSFTYRIKKELDTNEEKSEVLCISLNFKELSSKKSSGQRDFLVTTSNMTAEQVQENLLKERDY